jgi:hypothetical protein
MDGRLESPNLYASILSTACAQASSERRIKSVADVSIMCSGACTLNMSNLLTSESSWQYCLSVINRIRIVHSHMRSSAHPPETRHHSTLCACILSTACARESSERRIMSVADVSNYVSGARTLNIPNLLASKIQCSRNVIQCSLFGQYAEYLRAPRRTSAPGLSIPSPPAAHSTLFGLSISIPIAGVSYLNLRFLEIFFNSKITPDTGLSLPDR